MIAIVWQSVGGVYQDCRSVTHFVWSQRMGIGEISEGINETGKKTAKRVLCVELLCHYFVRTYDKLSVNFWRFADLHLSVFISVCNQLDAQNVFHNKFYFMPLHVSSTCAHHQEVKIALHSLWYHHTYRCDDTRDDEHICSKHVEAWNKTDCETHFVHQVG